MAHSPIGPSSHSGYQKCPGRVREAAKAPTPPSSVYADEGSAAHALSEYCIKSDRDPYDFVRARFSQYPAIEISAEMALHVSAYIELVKEWSEDYELETIVEARLKASFTKGWKNELFGTADCLIWNPKDKKLTVLDLKYGAGVEVDGGNNLQLRDYGVMALERYPEAETIRMAIYQPRSPFGSPLKEETLTREDLLKYRDEVLIPDIKATEDPNAPLIPGEHCKKSWCPAYIANTCPAISKQVEKMFNDGNGGITVKENVTLLAPATLTDEEISNGNEFIEALDAWVSSFKKERDKRVLEGRKIRGLKVVRGKTNRRYKPGVSPIDLMTALGSSDIFKPRELESFTTLEKKFSKKKDIIAEFLELPEGRLQVVSEDDPREPIKTSLSIMEEFGLLEE